MKMPESRTDSTLAVPFSEWVFNPAPILFLLRLYRNVKMWTAFPLLSCSLNPECSKMWVNPANAVLWELLFGFVPCSNYIGSRGYESTSKIESTRKKRKREDRAMQMLCSFKLVCNASDFRWLSRRVTSITGSFCRAPIPPPLTKYAALHFPKYSCYATKSAKTSPGVPKMYREQSFYPVEGASLSSFTNFSQRNKPHAYAHTGARACIEAAHFFMNGLVVRDWLRQHIEWKRNLHSWFGLPESRAV